MKRNMSYAELESLFLQMKTGDEAAFSQIYKATFETQYYMAYRMLHDSYLAEEVVQDTYTTFYQNMGAINNAKAIVSYLNSVNYHACLKAKLRIQRETPSDFENMESILEDESPGSNPVKQVLDKETSDELSLALDQIPDHLRSVLLLRYSSNMRIQDIADAMSISPRTVKRYLSRAAADLKEIMKPSSSGGLRTGGPLLSLLLSLIPFVLKR